MAFRERLRIVHGAVPESVRSVRIRVVFRLVAEYSVLLVVFPAVSREASKAKAAGCFVEVTVREHFPCGMYSVGNGNPVGSFHPSFQVFAGSLDTGLPGRVLVNLRVVWKAVRRIFVILGVDDGGYDFEHGIPASFPIVYEPRFASVELREPNGRFVSSSGSSQVPVRVYGQSRIVRNLSDPSLRPCEGEFLFVIRPLDSEVESLFRERRVFSGHVVSLFVALLLPPAHLGGRELHSRVLSHNVRVGGHLSEVFDRFLADGEVVFEFVGGF